VLTHHVPFLWRFHQPHHVDLDLDTSTTLRFHFGEMLLSVPWRAAQILCLGVSRRALSVWQKATLLGIMFHHPNLRLPFTVERWLCHLVVTPRMHGIHHSMMPEETNSNWSSRVLSLWDRLHGTLRLHIPQPEITIGIPASRQAEEVTLEKTLVMPFITQRPSWQLPGNGQPHAAASQYPKINCWPKRILVAHEETAWRESGHVLMIGRITMHPRKLSTKLRSHRSKWLLDAAVSSERWPTHDDYEKTEKSLSDEPSAPVQ
jgi:Fatty acid hydroxylase superfamily